MDSKIFTYLKANLYILNLIRANLWWRELYREYLATSHHRTKTAPGQVLTV
jgi:hypothetical protein